MGIFESKMNITVYEHFKDRSSKLVSLIRELEGVLGKEEAHKIVSHWAEKNAVEDVRTVIESLDRPIESFNDVKVLLRHWVDALNKDKMESVEITEETANKSVCIVTECIYAKVFNDLKAPDIGYVLHCKQDFPATPAIHPNMRLKRSKTVMEGQDCCDFEYYWKSK
ncbi:MAG: L-2-amino-thiazoline-4-carboxylic acid hydrolase [Candidatus Thorarchaeota archaeon]